jgi:hypothetical protein
VASIYGLKIRKIKENIQDTEGKIKDDQKKLEAARIVSADAQRMSVSFLHNAWYRTNHFRTAPRP